MTGTGELQRYASMSERVTDFQTDAIGLSAEELRGAASVLAAIAASDIAPLRRAVPFDPMGSPITRPKVQKEAWAMCRANEEAENAA